MCQSWLQQCRRQRIAAKSECTVFNIGGVISCVSTRYLECAFPVLHLCCGVSKSSRCKLPASSVVSTHAQCCLYAQSRWNCFASSAHADSLRKVSAAVQSCAFASHDGFTAPPVPPVLSLGATRKTQLHTSMFDAHTTFGVVGRKLAPSPKWG